MFRITAIYALILILLFEIFHKSIVIGYFLVFRQEIITKHCVNRDKKVLKCNGKCKLSKMLAESNTDNPDNPIIPIGKIKKILDQETLYFTENFLFLTIGQSDESDRVKIRKKGACHFEWKNTIFHPPDNFTSGV